ncbi:unnamed protein product [Moneuplotes crassus]|uniref:DNA-directed RNA polymerase RBP11-like dimerisation domain-containing protein n=1 Tax=Euplotes crassus TaxID=5936 RepID=A0AAD1Y1I4_EUPCR|nr:unnamed protein product [Moneuplotes crassus]
MNTPAISELFSLPPDVKKIEHVDDTKAKHAAKFVMHLEDHTAGNLLRYSLLRNENVKFSGYRRPHPLENKIELKVHTNGKISPKEAAKQACDNLCTEFIKMKEAFLMQVKEFKGEGK